MRIDGSGLPPAHLSNSANIGKTHGIFIGKVKNVVDDTGQGSLRVWIPEISATDETNPTGWFLVKYCPPFGGATNTREERTANNSTTHREASQSYGMWMVPPTLNVQVICGFINGNINMGIWWAVLPQDGHTHSLPGVASGSTHDGKIRPVGERNRYNTTDSQQENRPEHPSSHVIAGQGLQNDLRRGHTNAGPFRAKDQHPGLAYGVLSPGQHSVMLDDGPDGISGAIRLRTARGHQILMHDEGKFIYIVNQDGSAWIELDEKGNIDFYAAGDFSVHAEKNINFHAGDNFNVQAANNININAINDIKVEACEVLNLTGTNGTKITSRLAFDVFADGGFKLSAQKIDFQPVSPAAQAELPGANSFVSNTSVGRSVSGRVPEREPWGGHGRNSGGENITTPRGVTDPALGGTNIEPIPDSYNIPPESANAVDCIPRDEIDKTTMSETAFNMTKSREAYRGMMYSDYQGYSVGYGTRVDIFGPSNPNSRLDPELQQALVRGPSEPEARQASRQVVDRHVTPGVRTRLKQQMEGKNVCITQAQFDALCMAAYGNPSEANRMTDQLVSAAAKSPDGRASNEDVAKIWANSRYSNDGNQRNIEAQYALTGNVPDSVRMKTPEQLAREGQAADLRAVQNNQARNPQYPWRSELGNGPQSGQRIEAAYGSPSAMQREQFERSYYLNNGQAPPNSRYSTDQLSARYGAPQTGSNVALIRSPTPVA